MLGGDSVSLLTIIMIIGMVSKERGAQALYEENGWLAYLERK
jgi:hypothetical protein